VKRPQHLTLDIDAVLTQFNATQWLGSYWEHLSDENSRVNLVSRETRPESFRRMVAEALLPFTQLPAISGKYLDIGSGGGIPSLPVLLAGLSTGPTLLFERTKKKALALERIVSALKLPNITVVPESFGECPLASRFPLVTMSWVTLTPQLFEAIKKVMTRDGTFVYYSRIDIKPAGLVPQVFSYSQIPDDTPKYFSIITK
jgi:16S rRNA G527 N7-methylase RsmG